MPESVIVAIALILLASVFVLFPVMMRRSAVDSTRSGTNIALFKERLQELESEREQAELDEDEFQHLKTELGRRLLEDAESTGNVKQKAVKKPVVSRVLMLLLIPLLSYSVYQQTGAKPDWEIAETLIQTRHKAAAGEATDAEVTRLLQQLSTRLEQRPEHERYLMLIGNTQMQLQNYPAARDAFQRLAIVLPNDGTVLAQYAQALYLSSNRRLTDKVLEISNRALSIDPQQSTVLGMLGIARFEQGDYQAAINHWQQLLPALGPFSPNRKMIQSGIDQAKLQLIESGVVVESTAPATSPAVNTVSLQIEVALGDSINTDDNAVVFVFARAVAGPRMPLAVARIKVSDLPAQVTLDDSMAMAPGLTLSSFEQVEIVARISRNGLANRGSGDIEGRVGPVNVASISAPLLVIIDQVLP
ncbi:MAG: c-type cytochrome biogenesis protein CcmI [Pseudomonadales bacterium]